MPGDFESNLKKYGELAVRVGLNLQPDQRLIVRAPIAAAELVRAVAASAYDLGCRYVDVLYGDEQLELIRFEHAARDSFEEYPSWQVQGLAGRAKEGDAFLRVSGDDPDLLKGQDPELISLTRRIASEQSRPLLDYITRMAVNWCVISAAVPPWRRVSFPRRPPPTRSDCCGMRSSACAASRPAIPRPPGRSISITSKGGASC